MVVKLLLLLLQRSGQFEIERLGQVRRHFLSRQLDCFSHLALKLLGRDPVMARLHPHRLVHLTGSLLFGFKSATQVVY